MPSNTAALDAAELDPLVKPFWSTRELHRAGLGHQRAVLVAIRAGDIPYVKVGRRLLVPTAWVRKAMGLDESDLAGDDAT